MPNRSPAPDNPSLTDRAYEAIKSAILRNELRPGEPIPKDRLIREMGFTRTPLREALMRLEGDGLVEVRPRMGSFVSSIKVSDIQEMYQVRGVLEGLAARLATGKVPRRSLDSLRQRLESFDTSDRSGRNLAAVSEAGRRLHQLVIRHCGNAALAGSLESLQDHFTRFRILSLQVPQKVVASHADHLKVLSAIERDDAGKAERLMRAHFDRARRDLLGGLVADGGAGGELSVAT